MVTRGRLIRTEKAVEFPGAKPVCLVEHITVLLVETLTVTTGRQDAHQNLGVKIVVHRDAVHASPARLTIVITVANKIAIIYLAIVHQRQEVARRQELKHQRRHAGLQVARIASLEERTTAKIAKARTVTTAQ